MQATEVIKPAALLRVHARPHPAAETVYAEFRAGLSLREIIGPDGGFCRVEVGGMTVPQEYWHLVRPKVGCAIVISRLPQGGSAKSIFRLIAFAALAVGVALISGGVGGAFFAGLAGHLGIAATFAAGSLSAGLLAAGVGLVGSLLINALVPPSTPNTTSTSSVDTLRSITGSQNQLNPYGAVPVVLGEVLMFPPHAARQYSELLGDEQYLRVLLDLGEGDPVPSDMKIGDSDLATFTDVETEIGVNPSLFSQDVEENSVGVALNTDGATSIRASATNADELSVDWVNASGLFGADSQGNVVSVTQRIRVEWAVQGSSVFQIVDASTDGLTLSTSAATAAGDGTIHVTNAAKKAVRVGLRWKVPTGQYDVRLTRVDTSWGAASDDGKVGDLTWTALRTIRAGAVSKTGTKKIALRIKATDQLNGAISQFNCIVSQPIPMWNPDTSTWAMEFSRNPAWLFRWIMSGCPANARPVSTSRLDDDEIKDWAADCDSKGYVYSNCVDQITTLFPILQDICAAGRATFNVRDGKYSVVRDTPQTTPVQVFTPRNSWGFAGTRAFPDAVHALRVQFTNPDANWQQDERVVYDDGYDEMNATKFEVLTLRGVTDADAAWRLARYHLACGRLRPNTYSWNADIENLICTRGDLVQLANDVIDVGLGWGRVTDMTLNADGHAILLALDQEMVPAAGKNYSMRIRRQDGVVVLTAVTFDKLDEPNRSMHLVTPLTVAIPTQGQSGVDYDDLAVVGETGQDVLLLKITRIEPSADLAAKITAVDAAPAVLQADAGTPPPWSSSITGQAQISAPPPPGMVTVSSSQLLSPSDDGGITQPVAIVSVTGPWSGITYTGHALVDHIQVRYRTSNPVGAWTVADLPAGEMTTTITSVARLQDYEIEARALGRGGRASAWTGVNHTTSPADLGPNETPALNAIDDGGGRVRLYWTPIAQADVNYQVQAADGNGSGSPAWANLFTGSATSAYDFPGTGSVRSYRLRAVTYAGVSSAWSAIVTVSIPEPPESGPGN